MKTLKEFLKKKEASTNWTVLSNKNVVALGNVTDNNNSFSVLQNRGEKPFSARYKGKAVNTSGWDTRDIYKFIEKSFPNDLIPDSVLKDFVNKLK